MFRHLANACVCTLIVISSQHAIATENPDPWENVDRKILTSKITDFRRLLFVEKGMQR